MGIFNERVETMDVEKDKLKQQYEVDKQKLWESLEKAHNKQFELEKEVD